MLMLRLLIVHLATDVGAPL